MMLEPTRPASITRRVAKVRATPEMKLPRIRPLLSETEVACDAVVIRNALLACAHPTIVPNAQIQQAPEVRAPVPGLAPVFIGHSADEIVVKELSFPNR